MQIMPYAGWQRCARLISGDLEAIVTLEVGPRVIRFGQVGGPNEFVEFPEVGSSGANEFVSYGGHRFWIAPETLEVTYEPDNDPVRYSEEDGWHLFETPTGASGLQRSIAIRADDGRFLLRHTIRNASPQVASIAPWCLTVMAPGGECLIPQSEYRPHPEALLPARPVVLWHYTDMSDPRYTWGKRVVRLRHDPHQGPTKFGALVTQGAAAYANHGNLFIKRFPYQAGCDYLDFGCNFESFTRQDMLEVESLGHRVNLQPGESVVYPETWYLVADVTPPEDDEGCGDWLEKLLSTRPL